MEIVSPGVTKSFNFRSALGLGLIEFYAEEAKCVFGGILPSPSPDRQLFVLKQVAVRPSKFSCLFPSYQSLGIQKLFELDDVSDKSFEIRRSQMTGNVGAITPWNFPLAMVTRKGGLWILLTASLSSSGISFCILFRDKKHFRGWL